MEEKTLNILIVDNDKASAERTRTLLQQEEPRFRFDLACEGEEGLRKAKENDYHLILSDYHLTPAMNGLQLLDALRTSEIGVPFIFYSSDRSLERAVACLRRGVTDYLFKGEENIKELASSIAKAGEGVRPRRENQKLLQQTMEDKNYLENIVVNSIDAIIVADREGKVTLWNKGAEQIFGYTAEEVLGKHVDQFVVPPKFRRTEEELLKLVEKKGGSFLEKEVKRVKKSGEVIYTTASYNLVRDASGKIVGLSAIEKDITERKRLERELKRAKERYRLQYQGEQRRSAYLKIITQVSKEITAILDLEKLLQKVVNLIPALGYYQASIWTAESEKEKAVFQVGGGETIRISRGFSRCFKEGIIGWVACTGKPIIANDVSKEPRYRGKVYPETKSEISVPIRFGSRILGVLDVQSTELKAFTKEDLSALQILADQIAVAMENARLYEEARAKTDYLQSLVRSITDGIVSIDSEGRVVEWNKGAEKLLGYTREEILGKELDVIIVPQDKREEAVSLTERAMSGKEITDFETIRLRKDGWLVNVLLCASPITKDKKFLGAVAIYKDITERKRAEEQLKASEERYRELVNNSVDGVISVDPQMNIILWNPGAERIFWYTEKEMLGQTLMKIVPERYRKAKEKGFAVFRKTGSGPVIGKTLEVDGLRKDGTEVPIELSVSSRKTGEAYIATVIVRDITERKRAEEKIKKKSQELESFVYTVSHDLKAPLISIKGFSELLKASSRDRSEEKELHYLERVMANVDQTNRLIGDLLKLSRVGKTAEQPREVDTLSLAKKIVEELNLQFKIDHPKVRYHNLPVIYTDELHLRQIFQNLLGNAYKFRDENKRLEIEVGCTEKDNIYQFYVKDNGIGIDEKYLEDIFHIFRRLQEKKVEGTGAGLAIVKKIVETSGGKMWVKSAKDKGSTFYFTFPKKVKPTATKG